MRYFFALFVTLALSACSLFGTGGPYLVYFQQRSAELDSDARNVVALAAQRATSQPASKVTVVGYTDSAGSPAADVVLSQRRAQAVADVLVADGVAPSRLVRVGRGQTGTDPGLASRRVEIMIGGG